MKHLVHVFEYTMTYRKTVAGYTSITLCNWFSELFWLCFIYRILSTV